MSNWTTPATITSLLTALGAVITAVVALISAVKARTAAKTAVKAANGNAAHITQNAAGLANLQETVSTHLADNGTAHDGQVKT